MKIEFMIGFLEQGVEQDKYMKVEHMEVSLRDWYECFDDDSVELRTRLATLCKILTPQMKLEEILDKLGVGGSHLKAVIDY